MGYTFQQLPLGFFSNSREGEREWEGEGRTAGDGRAGVQTCHIDVRWFAKEINTV